MAAEEGGSGPKGGPPPQQTDPEVVQRKVYVHGTKGLNEEDLRWIFEHYGQVNNVTLKEQGYGFVEMAQKIDAEDAIDKLEGYTYEGNTLHVEQCKGGRKGFNGPPKHGTTPGPSYMVICESLTDNTSWQDLKDLGKKAGRPKFARTYRDDNQKLKGVVEFMSEQDQIRCVDELDGSHVRDNPIKIRKPKEDEKAEAERMNAPKGKKPELDKGGRGYDSRTAGPGSRGPGPTRERGTYSREPRDRDRDKRRGRSRERRESSRDREGGRRRSADRERGRSASPPRRSRSRRERSRSPRAGRERSPPRRPPYAPPYDYMPYYDPYHPMRSGAGYYPPEEYYPPPRAYPPPDYDERVPYGAPPRYPPRYDEPPPERGDSRRPPPEEGSRDAAPVPPAYAPMPASGVPPRGMPSERDRPPRDAEGSGKGGAGSDERDSGRYRD